MNKNDCAILFLLFVQAILSAALFVVRARSFRTGYTLAIDHIEQMTAPGRLTTYRTEDAIAQLRKETQ